jgi:hypothetical protein
MAKLDRLVWAEGISFTSFGVPIGIRVSVQELLDQVLARIPAGWKRRRSTVVDRLYCLIAGGPRSQRNMRSFHLLYADDRSLSRSESLLDLLEIFESDLSSYIAQAARPWLFVHAGVIGWKERAILIPGRSFSGKSTLVKAFLQAGATYYSDEFAVLDERGYVHPYPKPLSIRGGCEEKQLRVRVEELGAKTGVAALPVGLVLLTQFESAVRWRPRELSYGRGVLGLLSNTPAARMRPDWALKILATSVSRATILHGRRGEAGETVQSILGRLENRSMGRE